MENGGEYIFIASLPIKNTYFIIPQAVRNSNILLINLRTFFLNYTQILRILKPQNLDYPPYDNYSYQIIPLLYQILFL